ncbi:MAG: plasmid stabilization protein [Planctomycetes bacterium]|nr:plasmid stabilization protein [Planctomycetota bacterium]MBI3844813.1 plasmid stabilization protein [Planctomycetota bacterium]
MPSGDKSKYSSKQKRQARHIEKGYESRGLSEGEAAGRAWATVNKMTGGGRKGGSGHKWTNKGPARRGGRIGGRASAARPAKARSASARKAARTRARRRG